MISKDDLATIVHELVSQLAMSGGLDCYYKINHASDAELMQLIQAVEKFITSRGVGIED